METVSSSVVSQFWISYYAQILATVTILLVGFIISSVKFVLNRPVMLFWGTNAQESMLVTKRNRFSLNKTSDTDWDTTLVLSIRNMGNKTVERFNWEIYADKALNVQFVQREPYPNNYTYSKRDDGRNYFCYNGFITTPIFSGEDFSFPFELKIRSHDKRKIQLNYRFTTDGGNSPWYSWFFLWINKKAWLKSLIIE